MRAVLLRRTYPRTYMYVDVRTQEALVIFANDLIKFSSLIIQPVSSVALDAVFEMLDYSSEDPDSMVSLTHAQNGPAPSRLNIFPREYEDEKPYVRDHPSSHTYIGSL